MVLGLVLALLYKSFALSLSWAVLVVRVGSSILNPSPLLALHHSQPWMGCFGLCDCARGEVIGAMGRWELVRVSWEGTWDSGLDLETVGRAGLVLAGTGIGPSKSSQSLSIAHKWAVDIFGLWP
ncbi:hypothetical protein Tco_0882767 [Tanacetum coccineum]